MQAVEDDDPHDDIIGTLSELQKKEKVAHDPLHRRRLIDTMRQSILADFQSQKEHKITSLTQLQSSFIPKCCDDDEVLYRFAIARSGDCVSASRRFYHFCAVMNEIGLTQLTEPSDEAWAGLRTGVWHVPDQPDKQGRPIFNCYCKWLNWEKVTIKQMQHAAVYMFWRCLSFRGSYMAQVGGIVMVMYCESMTMGMIKMEFEHFCMKLMQQTMPMKFAAGYMVDYPWWCKNMMWPMFKMAIKEKLRNRMIWVGAEPKKEKGETMKYHRLHVDLVPATIEKSSGGSQEFVPTLYCAQLAQWVTDEAAALRQKEKAKAQQQPDATAGQAEKQPLPAAATKAVATSAEVAS